MNKDLPSGKAFSGAARSSIRFLLVLILTAVLAGPLALWWFGLGLDNGKAITASLVTLAVCAFLGEIIRRRFQINMRMLLVAFTLSAVVCAVLAKPLVEARRQQQAIALVHGLGGRVWYDYDSGLIAQQDWFRTQSGWLLPVWFISVLGEDIFGNVKIARLGQATTDEDLRRVAAGLTAIEDLDLSNTQITGDGLEHIVSLEELTSLSLSGNQISHRGMRHLVKLSRLERIDLSGPRVTDDSLKHLAQLTELRGLTIWRGTSVTNDGLAHMADMRTIESLNIGGWQIDDGGLAYLARLPRLQVLHLEQISVTDGGLRHIEKMPQLKLLSIFRALVTEQAAEELRQQSPHLDVRNTP